MPEDKQEIQDFKTQLIIELKTLGVDDAASAFENIVKAETDAGNSIKDLIKKYGNLETAVKEVAKAHTANSTAAKESLDSTKSRVDKNIAAFKKLTVGVSEAGAGLKKLVIPPSFGAALATVDNYNKTMLKLSSSVSRLGIGVNSLENSLGRMGREASLTRSETNRLFDDFQEGMRVVSVKDFESIMKRIRNVVGSNAEAIGKMSSSIAELSQSYPSLSRSLTQLAEQNENMNASEKGALQTRTRNLYLIGQISQAQYKQISSYINGNRQIGQWDSKRKKDMDAEVAAIQSFKRQWENVSMAVGKTLMPHLVTVAKWVDKIFTGAEKITKSIGGIGPALAIAMGAKGILSMGGKALGNLALGKISGGKGGKGGIGGVLGAVTGVGGTPVRVTNFHEMGGIGGIGGLADQAKDFTGPSTSAAKLGKFGKMPGKILGGLGAVVGGATLAYGGHKIGESLREKGKKMGGIKGYAMEVGGNLSRIGGSMAGGATIGAKYGGAPGAAIGAVVGAIGSMALLIKDEITGEGDKKAKKARREKGQFERELKGQVSDAEKERLLKKDIEGQRENARKAASGGNIASVYGSSILNEQKAQASYDEAVKAGGYEDKHKDLDKKAADISEAKAKYDRESAEMTDAQKEGAQAYLAKLQNVYDTTENLLKKEEERDPALQKALKTLQQTQAVAEEMTALSEKQQQIAADIGSLQQAQAGYMETVNQKMALMGEIDQGTVGANLKENIKLIRAEGVAYEEAAKILESKDLTPEEKAKRLEKQDPSMFKGLKEAGFDFADQVKTAAKILEFRQKSEGVEKRISDAAQSTLNIYELQLQKTGLLASRAGLLVQLADNYAIGVGASADMRIQQYEAENKAIAVLEQQLGTAKQILAADSNNEVAKNRILEIENEILQKQMGQAQMVKVLRDGWVSAISAQNTAMGGFSDIVMTNEKNLFLMQKSLGAVRSNKTGAVARRDSRGNIIENVGQDISERATYIQSSEGMAQMVGGGKRGGRGGRFQSAWVGDVEANLDARNLVMGNRESFMEDMASRGEGTVSSGASALGAENNIARGAYTERAMKEDKREKESGRKKRRSFHLGDSGFSNSRTASMTSETGQSDTVAEEVHIEAKNVYIEGGELSKVLANKEGSPTAKTTLKAEVQDQMKDQKQERAMLKAQLAASSVAFSDEERATKEAKIQELNKSISDAESGSKEKAKETWKERLDRTRPESFGKWKGKPQQVAEDVSYWGTPEYTAEAIKEIEAKIAQKNATIDKYSANLDYSRSGAGQSSSSAGGLPQRTSIVRTPNELFWEKSIKALETDIGRLNESLEIEKRIQMKEYSVPVAQKSAGTSVTISSVTLKTDVKVSGLDGLDKALYNNADETVAKLKKEVSNVFSNYREPSLSIS